MNINHIKENLTALFCASVIPIIFGVIVSIVFYDLIQADLSGCVFIWCEK